ncbi:MAG: glycosyltransferase family 4 protein [Paracoccaceae bacterium]|nr:glycosyltransferase family 4 protein [Paracoccaceae bacterium]
MASKRVLVIAYDFPPIGGSGVQRTLKYVKYLPEHGWDIDVLTVRETQQVNKSRDPSLLDELPSEVAVHRTGLIDPYDNPVYKAVTRLFARRKAGPDKPGNGSDVEASGAGKPNLDFIHALMLPDRMIGWFPFALLRGIAVIRRTRPSVIYSTSPCETAHLVGVVLSKLFSIPLVADFRDPWTEYYFSLRRPGHIEALNRWLERKVLRRAALVISTTAECSDSLKRLSAGAPAEKFHVITNGYDEGDFVGIAPKTFDRITIIFTGTVYQQVTPEILFQAVREMLDDSPGLADRMRLVFVGRQYDGFDALIGTYRLGEVVTCIGYVPHRESIAYLTGADACYYNVFSELAITAKLFEYLRSGTPIIAAIPESHSAARIIADCDAGVVVEGDNPAALRSALEDVLDRDGSRAARPNERVTDFERKKLASELSDALDGIIDPGQPGYGS